MKFVVFRLGIDLATGVAFINDDPCLGAGEQASGDGDIMLVGWRDSEAADDAVLIDYSVELKAVKPTQSTLA